MDQETLFKLMQNFDASSIRELSVDLEDAHVYLNKNEGTSEQVVPTTPQIKSEKESTEKVVAKLTTSVPSKATTAASAEAVVKAQLVGVVYLQPAPDKDNYVHVGDHIKKGQTVCVIEAMKMLTEVKSDFSGTIVQIDVNNEEMVDYDQPLMTIQKDA